MTDKIKTVSVTNNQEKFEEQVSQLLAAGYTIVSCYCSAHSHDGNIDEVWMAIMFKQDLTKLRERGKR